jgi:hypothetical protein
LSQRIELVNPPAHRAKHEQAKQEIKAQKQLKD